MSKVLKVRQLSAGPMETLSPFIFCVYHKDFYPKGNDHMEVPNIKGNGADFDPSKEFRMYHGDRVPGFPRHPHRGFETLTATLTGTIDHSDSLGNGGRYGDGDLQWLSAGKGIVHGENFPLVHTEAANPLKLFQIWLNLPKKSKLTEPDFLMHWKEEIPILENQENGSKLTIYAGDYKGINGGKAPKNSWGAEKLNFVAVYFLELSKNGKINLDGLDQQEVKSKEGSVNRVLYMVEGKSVTINGKEYKRNSMFPTMIQVSTDGATEIKANDDVQILILQGREILEPVVQHGPFVMNTREEIMQAFRDYQETEFGGWPYDNEAVVFPKDKTRFAKINGVEYFPPSK